ncbi:hypothetical protein BDZ97DRAFT_1752338 [Flammula alnicola]|nr:hypothetical protein BDZ97DRAFT_1752338 [Flammula alnicola]
MASNNQVDVSSTPPAYNQNLCDIWDGRSHTTPEEQVAIKEARFTALFNAAHNLDTAQIHLQDEYPIPEFTAFTQAFLDYHDAVPEGTVYDRNPLDSTGSQWALVPFNQYSARAFWWRDGRQDTAHLAWKLTSEGVDKVIQHIEDKHVVCYLVDPSSKLK